MKCFNFKLPHVKCKYGRNHHYSKQTTMCRSSNLQNQYKVQLNFNHINSALIYY
jgi:hypothetical protein